MPGIGKSYKSYRSKAKKYAKAAGMSKPAKKAVKAIVKAQMNKVIETKHADYNYESEAVAGLYHDVFRLIESDPLSVGQGVESSGSLNPNNRVGNKVFSKGIQFKMVFYNFADRPNLAYRIMILKVKPDTPSISDPTLHIQSNCSGLILPIDTENSRIKRVVYDKVFVYNNNASNPSPYDTKWAWEYYLKINQNTQYEDAAQGARNYTYNLFVLAYDTVSTNTTDNIARFSYTRRHLFTDA